ncbi:MAG: 16S rRNA (guanine(527)-N(7))-methyltransferase RsmG [Halothiobacillaceae bacterium]|jgi:16S rRNA (guanine527-N7)-methyltransferase|nr:16S rRNA (guanine(527)-N(7))-methyltransferase RsmG [Halothiobacillaceae bacterium]MDY0050395.1 16S rRNA (guanine(527)-N(7))-methyltransferase RsmG [Halothiobacillaceae bacterium]
MDTRIEERLKAGVQALGLSLDAAQIAALLAYLALLVKWNRAYNLTAVRDPLDMVDKHLLDSLAVLPWIDDTPLADVGCGPGLPGIVIAICRPSLPVTLIDSNLKMLRFAQMAVRELRLGAVESWRGRVEQWEVPGNFGQVISRAFASLPDFLKLAGHLCRPDGRLLAMKGRLSPDELGGLPAGYVLEAAHALHVPGLHAERHLVLVRPLMDTPL